MKKPLDINDRTTIDSAEALHNVAGQFGVQITPIMRRLIDANNHNDPIAKQFIPSVEEYFVHPEEIKDPISDFTYSPVEGIVHRHKDRVLLKIVNVCAVHCRFCFRREQIGTPENRLSDEALENAYSYIEQHSEIWEVILTGGDPLVLSDRRLQDVMERLNAIPHVKIIRIHTRVPVVNPARISDAFIQAMRSKKPVYILLHCNHPREMTPEAITACARIIDAGMPMLSQSALLHGVNDDAETLASLMRCFVENRIKPYYLHHGDLARGTSHFRTSIDEGQQLMRGLREMSGLCQPTYLVDIPGGHGKVSLAPNYATKTKEGWSLEDSKGERHTYKDALPPPRTKG